MLGCAPASLHPIYDYSIPDSQADCRAPFRYFRVSCSPSSGGSQRQTQAGHKRLVPRFLCHSLRDHCETLCQRAICFQAPSSMAKGRGSLHFQTSYPRERFEEKNYRQIPQGMLRYAAPPSCGSKHRAAPAAGARKDKLRPVTSALFRASCTTRCAVTARPFANEQYAFNSRAVWQRVAAVCLSILFSRGLHTLTRKLHKRQIATLFCRGLRRPTFTLFGKTARKDKNADCTAVLLGNPFCWSIQKWEKTSEKQKFYGQ